jgi:DUF177 domain-containing protein
MAALIRFPAVDVQIDGLDIDVPLPEDWLRKALADSEVTPRADGGHLSGRLSRSGSDIVVRAKVVASVELACARCLDPAPIDVASELSLLLQPRPKSAGRGRASNRGGRGSGDEGYVFTAAEAQVDVYDGETVVLDGFVREAILLEVPNFPLCRDSCPGLQIAAAEPLAEARAFDPRLAPLDAFRDKSDDPVTIDDLVAAAAERSASLRGRKPILKANLGGLPKRGKKKR